MPSPPAAWLRGRPGVPAPSSHVAAGQKGWHKLKGKHEADTFGWCPQDREVSLEDYGGDRPEAAIGAREPGTIRDETRTRMEGTRGKEVGL